MTMEIVTSVARTPETSPWFRPKPASTWVLNLFRKSSRTAGSGVAIGGRALEPPGLLDGGGRLWRGVEVGRVSVSVGRLGVDAVGRGGQSARIGLAVRNRAGPLGGIGRVVGLVMGGSLRRAGRHGEAGEDQAPDEAQAPHHSCPGFWTRLAGAVTLQNCWLSAAPAAWEAWLCPASSCSARAWVI